ncbi:DUF6164 family protein [Pseudoxanthomonas wuyuanensis]|jgi:hypothetical protein|uniref:Signal transducing protein n=1 Tax=Pseudoxanthomonas wuyuanensis TaxID=1073196 RepID=A0A286CX25_9GAMM|nr:DUF6164 family protein [Pseudoxanthomonas wuyuanensis]KAF1720867.1 hypothetical protein CSC75_09235 [Pseudoxanthomonas wuyuanensis]SOD50952.1 hypothetical protein SAMN06296416_101375 [Pseudoxanthomonas wuyuanensis]
MRKLLLNLRNVPDDEAAEVRELLKRHEIAFYETQPSPWGVSAGGIWLQDGADFPRAKPLLDAYQAERATRARAEHAEALREGRAETFFGQLRQKPLYVLGMLAAVVAILLLTLALPYLFLR